MSALFAATYPERVLALILFGSFPRVMWAPDYPAGPGEEDNRRELEEDLRAWSDPERMMDVAEFLIPGADERSKRAMASTMRQSASPGGIEALHRMNKEIDIRRVLPAIRVLTLVMCAGATTR